MTSILLVDDHTLLRETLAKVLDEEPDLRVTAQAGDGTEAVAMAELHQPDIVLLDVEMPGPSATATVHRLGEVAPRSRIIILTMYESPGLLQEFLRLGVDGYLHKGVSRPHLVSVIRSTRGLDGPVTISVSRQIAATGVGATPSKLTGRELEVLELVGRAMSNRQIGRQLEIGEATVKRHLRNVFRKLDAVSRMDAVNRAVSAALIPPPTGYAGTEPGPVDLRRAGRRRDADPSP